MKHALIGLLAAAFVGPFCSPAYAVNCAGVTYTELIQKLRDMHFPVALLSKVHVDENELRAQGGFAECPPKSAEGETAFIYSWRHIEKDGPKGLGVSFTFFEFSNTKAREAILRKRIDADAREQAAIKKADPLGAAKVESDVYYYVDPKSTKAFRVERNLQYVIE